MMQICKRLCNFFWLWKFFWSFFKKLKMWVFFLIIPFVVGLAMYIADKFKNERMSPHHRVRFESYVLDDDIGQYNDDVVKHKGL